jgi:hypothetical protein
MERLNRRPRQRGPAGRRDGLTLVEVMIASVLLAFGLLAMLALQLHAMRGGQVGRHYTQAAQIARDQMELIQRLPWNNPGAQPTGWTVPAAVTADVETEGGGTTTEQTYLLDWRIAADPAAPLVLRQIDVRVTWYEEQDEPAPTPPRRRYAMTSVRFNDES